MYRLFSVFPYQTGAKIAINCMGKRVGQIWTDDDSFSDQPVDVWFFLGFSPHFETGFPPQICKCQPSMGATTDSPRQKPNQIRCCWPGPGWLGLDAPSRPKSGRTAHGMSRGKPGEENHSEKILKAWLMDDCDTSNKLLGEVSWGL